MNIVVYIVLWVFIGLFSGFIASWLSDNGSSRWFWANLGVGLAGAILFGYFVSKWMFGMDVVLSAYSLVFALFGTALLLLLFYLWNTLSRR